MILPVESWLSSMSVGDIMEITAILLATLREFIVDLLFPRLALTHVFLGTGM